MRFALVIAMSMVACEGGSSPSCEYDGVIYEVGDNFPASDGCNSCHCSPSGVQCTLIACIDGGVGDGGVDGSFASCAASNGCVVGPSCGATCCGQGEKCVGGTCMCGNGPACGANDTCEAAGPIGGDSCGSICCGFSGPCPL